MTIEDRLTAAVTPVVATCVHGVYTGTAEIYCTYNFFSTPDCFGDDEPEAYLHAGQLHLFMPVNSDPRALKKQLLRALLDADLGPATVEDASDEDNIHLVFEFEAVGGEV